MRSIWLVRHGNRLDFVQPEWFEYADRRYDPPLCPAGQQQARELSQCLLSKPIDHVFVSPFLRTLQTAHYLTAAANLPMKLEAGLGEWHNPDWMTEAPVTHSLAMGLEGFEPIDRAYKSFVFPAYPESHEQMSRRSVQAMQMILERYSGNILFVGHKAPLGSCFSALLGTEQCIDFEVGGITELGFSGDRWQCIHQNDINHLTNPGIKVAPP
ncbi:MAG: histidine phosphatase family protein [Limnothrix sp. RL_2_0]|nr:histidine phosphatase family protein [Limnothrix sp. RL_2_0]